MHPSKLVPVALVGLAFGLAFGATGASASPDQSTKGSSVVGSGNENVYSVQGGNLPPGPNPGKQLFIQGCSTCHGINGLGTKTAPSLIGVGAAAVDFYISSGRMPLAEPIVEAPRKTPRFNAVQRAAIVDYVASLGVGPPIPTVDVNQGDLVEGNQLYAENCAGCHNAAGSGGALGKDYYAPRLSAANTQQIGEAIRVGPGPMPVFGPNTFTDQQVNSLVKYVHNLKTAKHPGGFTIGSIGPVSEGFIAWVVGLGALLALSRWIGTRV